MTGCCQTVQTALNRPYQFKLPGRSLASNRTWCSEMLRLEREEVRSFPVLCPIAFSTTPTPKRVAWIVGQGFELGMHGVQHQSHGELREFEGLDEVIA